MRKTVSTILRSEIYSEHIPTSERIIDLQQFLKNLYILKWVLYLLKS